MKESLSENNLKPSRMRRRSKMTKRKFPAKNGWQDALQKLREEKGEQRKQIAILTAEAENWKESAAQFCRNEEYYRGLLDKVASYLGPDVFVSDDGSVQDGPLRAKVPEMVAALAAENNELRRRLHTVNAPGGN